MCSAAFMWGASRFSQASLPQHSWLLLDDKTAAQDDTRSDLILVRRYLTGPAAVYITCIWHSGMFRLQISIQLKYPIEFDILGNMLINFLKSDEKIDALSCLCINYGARAGIY